MAVIKPVFRIFDYDKAVEFYVNWLGFTIDWVHRYESDFPVYMQVSLHDIAIHLSEHHNDSSPGARIHFENFPNLREYHQLLTSKNYKYNHPGIGTADWDAGLIKMDVIDPFRNSITFTGIS